MALSRTNRSQPPVEPLLDRLADRSNQAGPRGLRDLRDVVRIDLENLLNTRWRFQRSGEPPAETRQSLLDYGIPDFTGAPFADPARQREFCRILEQAIRLYEPRLRSARVTLRSGLVPDDRVIRFRIEALLMHGEVSERTTFESELDANTTSFKVGVAPA